MRVRKKSLSAGLVLCAGYVLGMAATADAQIFQGIFPAGGSNDAARGGVLHTPDGGSISVGESQSSGSGDYDIYVVKTDRCGSLEWSTTYDFGGDDIGRKIRMTDDGGYVLVGSTDNRFRGCSSRDILLMQIDSKGLLQWAHTYGGSSVEEGNDVQSYFGKGYVVAGTTSSFGFGGKANGYLLFVNLDGSPNWARNYGGDVLEGFNSCAITPGGDILAAGSSRSFTGNEDLFIVRTDNSGSLIWANIYPTKGTEDARCIISFGKDEIMVAGYTTDATNTRDGLLVHLDGNGTLINDRIYAEANLKFDDELAEVHQIPNGNFIVTGYMTNAPGAFGRKDVYLSEVDAALDIQWYSMHGGERDDEGFSVAYSASTRRQSYTVAGVTNSFAKGEDLYLIRALTGGKSGCNDTQGKIEIFKMDLPNKQIDLCVPHALAHCETKAPTVYHKEHKVLCTNCKFLEDEAEDPELGQLNHKDMAVPENMATTY